MVSNKLVDLVVSLLDAFSCFVKLDVLVTNFFQDVGNLCWKITY